MTKDEAIKVLKMVEAHGLADKAKSVAIEALETEAIPVEWIQKYADTMDSLAKLNPVAYRGFAEGADWIRNMVKNWREEHGTD